VPARILAILAILAFSVILLSAGVRAATQSGPPPAAAENFELSSTAERPAGTASSRPAQKEEEAGIGTTAWHQGREAGEAASGASRRESHATAGNGVESGPSSHPTSDPGSPLTRFSLVLVVLAVFVGTAVGLRRLV
jgi:hypothetical protein